MVGENTTEPSVQCGSTLNPEGTSGSPVPPYDINTAVNGCTTGEYVQLASGTWYISQGVGRGCNYSLGNPYTVIPNGVVLRGQSNGSTHFVLSSGFSGCGNSNSAFAWSGESWYSGSEKNVCDWTGGFSSGTTTIQLSNCGSTTPALGSNPVSGVYMILDQVDQETDNGNWWNCSVGDYVCTYNGSGGLTRNDGTCPSGYSSPCYRAQSQGVRVTAVYTSGSHGGFTCSSGSPCVDIDTRFTSSIGSNTNQGLYAPNWTSAQKPQAWFDINAGTNVLTGGGIENIQVDGHLATSTGQIFEIENCYGCWLKHDLANTGGSTAQVLLENVFHTQVEKNYLFGSQGSGASSYAIQRGYDYDSLIEDNICQQVTDSCPNTDGPTVGTVSFDNFGINSTYQNGSTGQWMQASQYMHANGDQYNLFEENIGTGFNADAIHGTHNVETLFRNYYVGQQAAGCLNNTPAETMCQQQTTAIQAASGARYLNIIGNLLGQAGYHMVYTCAATALNPSCASNGNLTIYNLGYTGNEGGASSPAYTGYCTNNPTCSSFGNYDLQVATTLFRWGNVDAVNGFASADAQFNSGEVPSSITYYPNSVPSSHTLPSSFFLSSEPSYWTGPWPGIGPDVSTGTGGTCSGVSTDYVNSVTTDSGHCASGGSYSNTFNGLFGANEAMRCFINTMGGNPSGIGSISAYNPSLCFTGSAPPPTAPVAPNSPVLFGIVKRVASAFVRWLGVTSSTLSALVETRAAKSLPVQAEDQNSE